MVLRTKGQPTLPAVGTIVVLVHGTFARNAAWTHQTSALFQGLTHSIQGEKSIIAFSWSGWNSPNARYKAAKRLRAELMQSHAVRPDWDIVLIGHSHGGTVAMRAIDCDELREHAKLVCLSTPFLQAFPRNLPTGAFTQLGAALSMLIAATIHPGLPFSHYLGVPQLVFPDYLDPFIGAINTLIFGAIFAGVFFLLYLQRQELDRRVPARQDNAGARRALCKNDSGPTRCFATQMGFAT